MSAVTVTLRDVSATTYTSMPLTLSLSVQNNAAEIYGTLSGTTLVTGFYTFSTLQMKKVGSYNLVALASEVGASVVSSAFSITTAAVSLLFTTSPVSISIPGQGFSVVVKALDANGVVDTSYTTSVTISTPSATVSGTATVSAVLGVASFSGLSISQVGQFILKATDSTLTATSALFTIQPQVVILAVTPVAAGTLFTVYSYLLNADGSKDAVAKAMTISKTSGPGNLIIGTAVVSAVDGNTEYEHVDAALDTAGSYVLTVTCTGCAYPTFSTVTVSAAYSTTVEVDMSLNYLPKGKTATYTIYATAKPAASFTIAIASANTSIVTVSTASVTFTSANYNTPQTVTVTAVSAYVNPTPIYYTTITHTASSTMPSHTAPNLLYISCDPTYISSAGELSLTLFQQVTSYLVLFSGSPVFNLGGSGTYTVVLGSQPTSNVVVTVVQPASLTVSPTSVTFTNGNWNTPQTFTVSSSATISTNSAQTIYISHTVSGDATYSQNYQLVPSTVKVQVLQTTSIAVLLSGDFTFPEGGSGSYGIVLTTQPTSTVSIAMTLNNAYIAVTSSNPVVFQPASYNTPQVVTVSAVSGSGAASMMYSTVITHTVTSTDSAYNGSAPLPTATVQATVVNVCTPGFYSYPPGAGVCAVCPQGYSCTSIYQQPTACGATFYSPKGEWRCLPCPGGYACNGSGLPTPCSAGTQSIPGAGVCTACASGTPCAIPDGSDTQPCGAGTYLPTSDLLCKVCPYGYSCGVSATTPSVCGAGTTSYIGSSTCGSCPAASYCFDPSLSSSIPCPLGYYSAAGSDHCTPCPAGNSCVPTGSPSACASTAYSLLGWGVCRACTYGSCTSLTDEVQCPEGQYLLANACTSCPTGTVCNGVLSVNSDPGTYSAGAVSSSPCALGTFSSYGATTCTAAVAGSFSINPVASQQTCSTATYATGTGSIVCNYCDPKYQCAVGSITSNPAVCANGYYCHPATMSQQVIDTLTPCPGGTTLSGTAHSTFDCTLCTAGKYCLETDSTNASPCASGHFCPTGTTFDSQYWCMAGTVNTLTGKISDAACAACSATYYCPQGSSSATRACLPGNYCPASASEPVHCPFGTYSESQTLIASAGCTACAIGGTCAQGSLFTRQCPVGTYNTNTSSKTIFNDCTLCTATFACPALGETIVPVTPCQAGYFCITGTHFPDEFPCPAGTLSEAINNSGVAGCTGSPCAAGYYCMEGSSTALKKKIRCPRGTLCSSTGVAYSYQYPCAAGTLNYDLGTSSGTCSSCPAGFYCARGSFVATDQCAQGNFCAGGNIRDDITPCLAGTYTNAQNLSAANQCTACPAGSYCYAGSAVPRACPPGTYASATNTVSPGTCTACTAGSYCASGTANPVSCGAGYYSAASAFQCDTCPAGSYCATPTPVLTQCPAGSFCPAGTSVTPVSNTAYNCPAGYYCTAGIVTPTPCDPGYKTTATGGLSSAACVQSTAGYYTIAGAGVDTGLCEPGFYCPAGSTGPYAVPCQANTFMTKPGGASSADCLSCPIGYYCPLGTTVPVICPAGSYCPAGATQPTLCPAGKLGQSVGLQLAAYPGLPTLTTPVHWCTDCPVGYYCSQPGLIVPDGTCAPGAICTAGSTSSTGNGGASSVCAAGGYCQPGLPIELDCPSGTYNPNTGAKDQSDCIPCIQGYYCIGSEVTPTHQCPAGYYCPTGTNFSNANPTPPGTYTTVGSASAIQCIEGFFNNDYAQSACLTCLAGFYCDVPAISLPKNCPAGSWCAAGAKVGIPCGIGTFNMMSNQGASTSCTTCTAGKFCDVAGLSLYAGDCDAGYWCQSGSPLKNPDTTQATYGPCPVGYYCLAGTALPAPCPTGTYLTTTLGVNINACTSCPAGSYCTIIGSSTIGGPCQAGFFCPAGTRTPTPWDPTVGSVLSHCIAGQYCPQGSTSETDCGPGYYQMNEFQASCKTCRQGYYCTGATGDYSSNTCGLGYYCITGTTTATSYGCQPGTYNPLLQRKSLSECINCDPGQYCNNNHMSAPAGPCSAGYFCKTSSTLANPSVPDPGDSTGGMCLAGTYCPAGSIASKQCDGGSYCGANALGAVSGQCLAGSYCISGSSSSQPTNGINGNVCPSGYYCIAGSVSATPCPIGTYLGSSGGVSLGSCINCPQGYYCSGVAQIALTSQCTAGYFCIANTFEQYPQNGHCSTGNMCPPASSAQSQCGAGTYQDLPLQSSCKICPNGFYCDGTAPTTPTTCTAGNYCPSGSTAPTPCPAGTYNQLTGMESVTACITCSPGNYCTSGRSSINGQCQAGYYCKGGAEVAAPSRDAQGGICQVGRYCPAGSTQQLPCTPGNYCSTTGLFAVTGQCLAGYYCIEAALSSSPMDGVTGDTCPAGYYCPVGSAAPTPCLPGTYNSSPGKTAVTDCLSCPPGFSCASLAATSTTKMCAAGYYCPGGQKTDTPQGFICPVGNYCPSGASSPTTCAAGTFNPQIGQSYCQACPSGFTCEGGVNLPVQCVAGYMCPQGSAVATIIPCEHQYYQPFPGQSTCVSCPIGFYCPGGPLTAPIVCPVASYCPSGTDTPFKCNPGTYSTATGLQSNSQCKFCPVGQYCTSGIIQGICAAGYFCESGSNNATPDGYSNSGNAYPCPIGYYCPAGTTLPIPCPSGQFRMTTGGMAVTDCTLCSAGYYCILNNPVPVICPLGSYCPAGSSAPTACPPGTYNSAYLATSAASCLQCQGGTLCNASGIGFSSYYPCFPGYYCPAGYTNAVVSPPTYYSPGSSAGAITDLVKCPGGYYCLQGFIGYSPCEAWTYCAPGSSSETVCPGGYFCGNVTATPVPCPTGWYCPMNTTAIQEFPPILCPDGAICPAISVSPTYCNLGQVAIKSYGVTAPKTVCQGCGPGTYANATHTACLDCTAGYVCLGNTTVATPTDLTVEHGYICTPGYYSDTGAFGKSSCPAGTYSIVYGGASKSSCITCPDRTYNSVEGMSLCYVCGLWANSTTDHTSCVCYGKNRVFLAIDKSCPCKSGFEYIDINGNSHTESGNQDCAPNVYSRCPTGQLRNEMGHCTSQSDCSAACSGGTGVRSPGLGICQCDQVIDVDSVCNTQCRKDVPKVILTTSGNITITNPLNSTVSSLSLSSVPGLAGKYECYQNQSCNVRFMDSTTSQHKGLYAPFPSLYQQNNTSGTRRLSAIGVSGIPNPVICINLGETMVFSLNPPLNYPVFQKDSLINTNPDFDYSQFAQLQSEMQAGWTNITMFVFTFNQPGIMLFSDAYDTSQETVISVMSDNTSCPDSDKYIQPRTSASLTLLGAKLNQGIILGVDWNMVYSLIFSLFISILIFTLLFYYYSRLAWRQPRRKVIPYREANKKFFVEGDAHMKSRLQMYMEIDSEKSTEEEELARLLFSRPPNIAENDEGSYVNENEDVDPAILQGILSRIKEANKSLLEQLQNASNRAEADLQEIMARADEIGLFLTEKVKPFSEYTGKVRLDAEEEPLELDATMGEESIPSNVVSPPPGLEVIVELDEETEQLKRKALHAFGGDVESLEQDKQKLMDELSSEYSKLQESMNQYRDRSENDLSRRLAERNKKRQNLSAQKRRLDQDLQDQKQQLEALGRKQAMQQAQEEVKIDQEVQMELFEKRSELVGPQALVSFEAMKAQCANNPADTAELLHAYERDLQRLEENLSMNQMKEKAAIEKRLEERRAKRQREAAMERKKKEEAERKEIQENLRKIEKSLEEVSVSEALANVLPMLDIRESDTAPSQERDAPTPDDGTNREPTASEQRRDAEHEAQQKQLENARARLRERIEASSGAEQAELQQELERIQRQIEDNEKRHSNMKKAELENRLAERRKLRLERQQDRRQRLEKDQKAAEQRRKAEDDKKRASALEQALKFARENVPPHMYQDILKALLEEKNEREVAQLRQKQTREQRLAQSGLIEEHFRRKANDLRLVRKDFKLRKAQADKNDPDYEVKLEAMNRAEKEIIANLDFTCAKDLEEATERVWKDLRRKQASDLSDLIDRQILETRKIQSSEMTKVGLEDLEKQLAARKSQMMQEHQHKIELMEQRKGDMNRKREQKQQELEDLIHREREDEERKDSLRKEMLKKRELEEKRRKFEEELRRRNISEDKMEQMLEDYQSSIAQAERMQEQERLKQSSVMGQKLAERRRKKQEIQESLDRIREEQDRWQKKLDSMPGLSHKEANKLLRRWRRYPKKAIKEVASSLSKPSAVRVMPQALAVSAVVETDSRMRELLQRVERVEAIARNIDSTQFAEVQKTLATLTTQLKR